MRTLSKVMCVSNEYDIEEWELSPLIKFIREEQESNNQHVPPAQKLLTTLLQSFWLGLTAKTSHPSQGQEIDCVRRAGNAVLGR